MLDSIDMRVMLGQELLHNHPLLMMRLHKAGQLEAFKDGRVKKAKAVQKELMNGVKEGDLNHQRMVDEVVRSQLLDLPNLDESRRMVVVCLSQNR